MPLRKRQSFGEGFQGYITRYSEEIPLLPIIIIILVISYIMPQDVFVNSTREENIKITAGLNLVKDIWVDAFLWGEKKYNENLQLIPLTFLTPGYRSVHILAFFTAHSYHAQLYKTIIAAYYRVSSIQINSYSFPRKKKKSPCFFFFLACLIFPRSQR